MYYIFETNENCKVYLGLKERVDRESFYAMAKTSEKEEKKVDHDVYVNSVPVRKGDILLSGGQKLRAQETGLLAAFGKEMIRVYKKPVISIISTGDEVVPIDKVPDPGHIRDINTYTLSGLVEKTGAVPIMFGIIRDDFDNLSKNALWL